ncbi:MAG TPA: N-acetylmuramoyl-L-alanine amidase [Alphaproteobacteria bacterium]|nr:N-acetylmuramoyl-L-alanine amidase [Alphaproteobacteria bacterium]
MQLSRKMCRIPWGKVMAAGLGLVLGLDLSGAVAETAATGVRVLTGAMGTRFVLDLSDEVSFKVYTMRDPYRVVVDLPELAWKVAPAATSAHGGVIERFRFGLFKPGTFRVVLDVNAPVAVHSAVALSPRDGFLHRLVLDLSPISKSEFDRTYVGPPPPEPVAARTSAPPPAEAAKRIDGRHVVVVDPGHGGVDPGTTGISGIYEKELTLAAAKELKRQLEASGRYQVILTRDKDVFLPLHERVQIARNARAELFISLHADSIGSDSIVGSSVYTLSEKASDAQAAALAADENKADTIAGANLDGYSGEVADILIDLAQRETKNDSAKYAHELVQELDRSGRMLEHASRSAGFAVLKAPDVPSVLLEMGYLSNPQEERELRDPAYRAKLMTAVKRAVDIYFAALDRMTKS